MHCTVYADPLLHMSKHASELVRGMGAAAHFIQYLSTHLPDEELYFLVTKAGEGTIEKMLDVARKEREATQGEVFTINPEGTDDIEKLIVKGNYDYENPSFRKEAGDFKNKQGSGAHTVATLIEKKLTDPKRVLEELKRDGYTPVSLCELLSFGIQYPRVQVSRWPIVTMDTDAKSDKVVPSLSWGNTGRRLGVIYVHEWSQCWVLCRKTPN